MKTFCPNCEKETDSVFVCEVYECCECGEDYENYEKPSVGALTAEVARLRGLLVRIQNATISGVDRAWLVWFATASLAGGKTSNSDVSTTQDVLMDIKTSSVNNE